MICAGFAGATLASRQVVLIELPRHSRLPDVLRLIALARPVPLVLLAMGIFYLCVYVRHRAPEKLVLQTANANMPPEGGMLSKSDGSRR